MIPIGFKNTTFNTDDFAKLTKKRFHFSNKGSNKIVYTHSVTIGLLLVLLYNIQLI